MRMKIPPHAVRTDLEVPFHDVDSLQIVWHGHYLKYAEIGRSAFLRARQMDMADLLELGVGMVVVDLNVRYSFPSRYADKLQIATWCTRLDHRINLAFVIENLTAQQWAARGEVSLMVTDRAGQVLVEPHPQIRQRLMQGEL